MPLALPHLIESNGAAAGHGSASIASSSNIADPRLFRIQKIRDSGVLDMQVEKFTHLNILPSTKFGLYMNELRVAEPAVKQVRR